MHPIMKKDVKLLEGVQHRATRMVPGFRKISYEERMESMHLHYLAYRRVRGDAIETFKYLNGNYKVVHLIYTATT
jgi:ribonucleases P/MRP protein subunit RPP40